MHADLQRLLAENLLHDLESKPMERLRALRREASGAEGDVSFVRRIAQGRLDIVGHERSRRASPGASHTDSPGADASAVLFEMPNILADPAADPSQPRSGRYIEVLEPGPIASGLGDDLDALVSPSVLTSLDQLGDGDLADLFDRLRSFEVELSAARRSLHDQIDGLQNEIARRYRDGEASVDALLRPDAEG